VNLRQKCFHRLLPDLATRRIDNATETNSIVGIEEEAEVRENILDFFTFIKPDSSIDLVRDSITNERFFDESRLTIGSIENRPVFEGTAEKLVLRV